MMKFLPVLIVLISACSDHVKSNPVADEYDQVHDVRFEMLEKMLTNQDKQECTRKIICLESNDETTTNSEFLTPFNKLRTLMDEVPERKTMFPRLSGLADATQEDECEHYQCPEEDDSFKQKITQIMAPANYRDCADVFKGFNYACFGVGTACAISGFFTAGITAAVCAAVGAGPCLGIQAGSLACDASSS